MSNRIENLHEALRTNTVSESSVQGLGLKLIELQNSKTDKILSLHVRPMEWSNAGFQSTDLFGLLGFSRSACLFFKDQCYVKEVGANFDVNGFARDFRKVLDLLKRADEKLRSCGLLLPAPEGFGFFFGKPSRSGARGGWDGDSDGHRAATTKELKRSKDQYFTFVLSWREGLNTKGWTIHYIPVNPPITPEIKAVMDFLDLKGTFDQCPFAEFEPCLWRFREFQEEEQFPSPTAEHVHAAFDSHQALFSNGVEELLEAHSLLARYGMRFLNIHTTPVASSRSSEGPSSSVPSPFPDQFDVAISFAKTEREKAETLATIVRGAGFNVFYDDFYPEHLWGKDLPVFFDEIYRKRSRYCVMFISKEYVERQWTNHERKSAQARALQEKGSEYILPLKVDETELPGMAPTIGYLSLDNYPIDEVGKILIAKLEKVTGSKSPDSSGPENRARLHMKGTLSSGSAHKIVSE